MSLTLIDAVVKIVLFCCNVLPNFGLKFIPQLVIHFLSILATASILILDHFHYNKNYALNADVLLTLIVGAVLSLTALSAGKKHSFFCVI